MYREMYFLWFVGGLAVKNHAKKILTGFSRVK
jgi:hypothetical protein